MRLDTFLFENDLFPSRTKAMDAIKEGLVLYNGKVAKCSQDVSSFNGIEILNRETNFVSNGGYKLEKALNDFNFSPSGLVCADIGASNGGFTDCLLKRGASKVFAIDVNSSQLDPSLLCDKVVVVDNCNARFLTSETLGERVDLVVCDVSFISLKYVLPAVNSVLKDNGTALMLIKPQFECGKEYLGNSGIVKSKQARITACLDIYNFSLNLGLVPINITNAPIKEKKNIEYVIMLKKGKIEPFSQNKIYDLV